MRRFASCNARRCQIAGFLFAILLKLDLEISATTASLNAVTVADRWEVGSSRAISPTCSPDPLVATRRPFTLIAKSPLMIRNRSSSVPSWRSRCDPAGQWRRVACAANLSPSFRSFSTSVRERRASNGRRFPAFPSKRPRREVFGAISFEWSIRFAHFGLSRLLLSRRFRDTTFRPAAFFPE
jgi:hypothetical protein